MKRLISLAITIAFVLSVFVSCVVDSTKNARQDYKSESKREIILQKNFPLLYTVLSNDDLQKWMHDNESLRTLASSKKQALTECMKLESPLGFKAIDTIAQRFSISDTEMQKSLEEWLKQTKTPAVSEIIDSLRATNQFYLKNRLDDEDFIRKVWLQELNGINKIIAVYATGVKPNYPDIDSVTYDVHSNYYKSVINIAGMNVMDDFADEALFFEPSLDFALWLMEGNKRDEAARFEPMESGENAAAVKQVAQTDWKKYPYSVILVPGHGPEEKGISLSPMGMMRCKLAADRYFKGLAPFIIVSGGYVHPFQTPFCEAFEMKKELMKTYDIPESAIIIEPHARHTTTNFRNAARLIFNYRIPADKKALCTTTMDQSFYITLPYFSQRCEEELGYLPHRLGDRLSRNDVEFYPLQESCTLNCKDPLDP